MYFFNKKIFLSFVVAIILVAKNIFASDPIIVERDGNWTYSENNTTYTSTPSKLNYYKYYEILPDEITIPIVTQRDLTDMAGKKIVIGYGVADPMGNDCRIFTADVTGLPNDIKICLPWWRIEREYQRSIASVADIKNILCQIPTPKPPISVNVCKKWADTQSISRDGGKTTCTSYYDRLQDSICWNDPQQPRCFVDNCSDYVKENCEHVGDEMGETTTLHGISLPNDQNFISSDTKIGLVSHQYECPAGVFMPFTDCEEEETVLMYPYTCKAPTANLDYDDGEYIYCDEDNVQYDADGNILGFLGTCPDGREVMCDIDKFSNTSKICTDPIMANVENTKYIETSEDRTCTKYSIDAISGESDAYSENENCLRSNSISEARQTTQVHMVSEGGIDDDILVFKHRPDGSMYKVYCNIQHPALSSSTNNDLKVCLQNRSIPNNYLSDGNITCSLNCLTDADNLNPTAENIGECIINTCSIPLTPTEKNDYFDCGSMVQGGTASMIYNGNKLSCILNNLSYSFDETVEVEPDSIFSVQFANEYQSVSTTPFFTRDHYGSSKFIVDGVVAAPAAGVSLKDHPYYPRYYNGPLALWDNSLGTLSFLFPYAGAYAMHFYDKNGNEIANKTINATDFENTLGNYISLNLIEQIPLAPGRNEDDPKNCLSDDLAEPGGGVWGGKQSSTGEECYFPDDEYSKAHAIYDVTIKDILTEKVTSIHLAYPMVYLNRIYVAKMNTYETRDYCCYDDF